MLPKRHIIPDIRGKKYTNASGSNGDKKYIKIKLLSLNHDKNSDKITNIPPITPI